MTGRRAEKNARNAVEESKSDKDGKEDKNIRKSKISDKDESQKASTKKNLRNIDESDPPSTDANESIEDKPLGKRRAAMKARSKENLDATKSYAKDDKKKKVIAKEEVIENSPMATEKSSKVKENKSAKSKEEKITLKEDKSAIIKEEEKESVDDVLKDDKWQTGEKILCFHGPLIYEAKIQTVEVQNGIPKYFIHYHGWNKNWDEWVPEARMLKHNEKNVLVQKDLVRAHNEKNSEKRRRGMKRKPEEEPAPEVKSDHVFAVPKTPSPVPRPRRKAGLRPKKLQVNSYNQDDDEEEETTKKIAEVPKPPDNTVEAEEIFKSKVEIKVKIPDELKSYIVDDWEQITRHKNLCVLPANLNVEQLLENYTRAKTSGKSETASKNNREKAIAEVTAGLKDYFNVMLPAQLLFKQERAQYEQLKKDCPSLVPITTYGAPHLLRLFTKIGEALVYTPLGEKSISLLLFYLHDILNYMKKNASIIFSNTDYQSANPLPTEVVDPGPGTSKPR